MHMQDFVRTIETIAEGCLGVQSRKVARAISGFFNGRLRDVELNVAQMGLLVCIAKQPGANLREIGEHLLLDESTVQRNLAVLMRRGLIEGEGGRGRTGKRIMLSEAGVRTLTSAMALWEQCDRDLRAALGEEDANAGLAFMNRLIVAAEGLHAADEAKARTELAPAK